MRVRRRRVMMKGLRSKQLLLEKGRVGGLVAGGAAAAAAPPSFLIAR